MQVGGIRGAEEAVEQVTEPKAHTYLPMGVTGSHPGTIGSVGIARCGPRVWLGVVPTSNKLKGVSEDPNPGVDSRKRRPQDFRL